MAKKTKGPLAQAIKQLRQINRQQAAQSAFGAGQVAQQNAVPDSRSAIARKAAATKRQKGIIPPS